MNRWTTLIVAIILFVAMGCSSGGGNPVTPTTDLTNSIQNTGNKVQTHLWGYYDVYIDIPTQTATAVLNRDVMFAANVVQFVNKPPTNLGFLINDTFVGTGYLDVDIDVSIKHPFTGLTMYNGYDVRGIFMGDATQSLEYNSALQPPDQHMLPDPDDQIGGADGYTRWFNAPEFMTPGLFGYKPGVFASKAYTPDSTLNPYKYFADGLGAEDDLWDFLTTTTDDGVFSAGTTNTRNYYLRFMNGMSVQYGYAIVANWEGEGPEFHPSNAPESVGLSTTITDNIYYVDETDNGGDLILDLSVFGWNYQPSTIYVESNVLSAVHPFDSTEMTPTGGDVTYSTYHCEIPTDNVTGIDGNYYWVICEYPDFDYTNEFGVTNLADTDFLTAIFRYDLFVSDTPYNQPPTCDVQVVTAMPHVGKGWIEFDASGSSDPDGDVLTYSWDFNGDATFGDTYDAGTDSNPIKNYNANYVGDVCVQVSDGTADPVQCCVAVNITALMEINVTGTPNISLGGDLGSGKKDIAINPTSDQVAINYKTNSGWKVFSSNYGATSQYSHYFGNLSYWDFQPWGTLHGCDYFGTGHAALWTWSYWTGPYGGGSYFGTDYNGIRDCCNMQGNTMVWSFYDMQSSSAVYVMNSTGIGGYSFYCYGFSPWYNGAGTAGVVMTNFIAMDAPKWSSGNYKLYTLEKTTTSGGSAVVERWNCASSTTMTYDSLNFGDGFLFNPLDISVDSNDYVYILDTRSDASTVIWAYNNAGTLIGTSDPLTASQMSGTPLRLDVALNPSPDEIHLLHSNGVTKFIMQ